MHIWILCQVDPKWCFCSGSRDFWNHRSGKQHSIYNFLSLICLHIKQIRDIAYIQWLIKFYVIDMHINKTCHMQIIYFFFHFTPSYVHRLFSFFKGQQRSYGLWNCGPFPYTVVSILLNDILKVKCWHLKMIFKNKIYI